MPSQRKNAVTAMLMPKARRRQLAAYFTPPHLARYAIDVLVGAGVSPSMLAPGHELSVAGDAMSIAYRRTMADIVAAARQGPGPLAALVRTA